jgi:hypothetical protein
MKKILFALITLGTLSSTFQTHCDNKNSLPQDISLGIVGLGTIMTFPLLGLAIKNQLGFESKDHSADFIFAFSAAGGVCVIATGSFLFLLATLAKK